MLLFRGNGGCDCGRRVLLQRQRGGVPFLAAGGLLAAADAAVGRLGATSQRHLAGAFGSQVALLGRRFNSPNSCVRYNNQILKTKYAEAQWVLSASR